MRVTRLSPCFQVFIFVAVVTGIGLLNVVLLPRAGRGVDKKQSAWVFRSQDGVELLPIKEGSFQQTLVIFDESKSPYIQKPGTDMTGTVYTKHKPEGAVEIKTIGFYNPLKQLNFLLKTNFSHCEYDKCQMVHNVEVADAVLFLVARLTTAPVPTFYRKPGQLWILKTDEAPSRFTWFESLDRAGLRDQFNWTLTHKLDSDIPIVYSKLIRNDIIQEKDYGKIFDGKTRTAAWFVSHCPVRSDRLIYVHKMQNRTDIDVFGKCGNYSCGTAELVPGVQSMRKKEDKQMCFPILTSTYKFYLAFENSLCQEYISEKFFKIFDNVDVVPVVRGGADYKRYFPPDMYVDASDFSTPEALADYLDDLGNDRDRYITYLRNKDRYRMIPHFPDWQCQLCERLHTDHRPHQYHNIHQWWTHDSCHDPIDSLAF
ncbi:alpha-(1,3)-fucosyltransferase C-like [Physella acuta]|uniref:alpha-(1,3)-fucosyltransferase C-like n=1 Tax=Physella acuta TaxID=109671 RepID=UPI0027DD1B77|nr:alpha-(1,3)-fucosyltransferase C-like [Physella acuta]